MIYLLLEIYAKFWSRLQAVKKADKGRLLKGLEHRVWKQFWGQYYSGGGAKLSLSMPLRHIVGVEVQLHSFLTSMLLWWWVVNVTPQLLYPEERILEYEGG